MKMFARLRFLPTVIFVASLLLTIKIGEVWQGIGGVMKGTGVASAKAQQGAAPPAQRPPQGQAPAGQTAAAPAVPEAGKEGAAKTADAKEGDGKAKAPRRAADDPTLLTQAEIDLLQQLAERRETIEKREQEIDRRAAMLRAAEVRIDKKVEELKALQATIEKLVKAHDDQQEKKVAALVKIYENMKPKDAAKIFEDLDMEVLLMVAERINTRKLAPIMAAMNPQKAREVTVELSRLRDLPEPGSPTGG